MLSPQLQAWHVKGAVPAAVYRGNGVIELPYRPSPVSRTYLVRIDYGRAPAAPRVWIARPLLHPQAPHRYPNGSLCLFFEDEWTPDLSFARTIVPWTFEWIACYELWLETDRWLGPEAPHGESPKESP
jgi:hypothetical protein